MIFGAQTFCEAPFASQIKNNISVTVTGNRLDLSTGTVSFRFLVDVTGSRIDIAKGSVSVILWNEIDPNVNMVWTPIDPDE